MFRNAFGQTFTARNLVVASLLRLNLNDLGAVHYFNGLPRTQSKGRSPIARSHYIPAGTARNTPVAINHRKVRRALGITATTIQD